MDFMGSNVGGRPGRPEGGDAQGMRALFEVYVVFKYTHTHTYTHIYIYSWECVIWIGLSCLSFTYTHTHTHIHTHTQVVKEVGEKKGWPRAEGDKDEAATEEED